MKSQLGSWSGLLAAAVVLLGMACSGGSDSDDGRLRVVATTTQIGDFAANVGGDLISLTVLLKPNQDAHDFDPSPSQIRALERANVVLRNGIGLDSFVSKALGSSSARVVIVSEGITLREAADADSDDADASFEAAGRDPHVWFSVANARAMVRNVRAALATADPPNAAAYEANEARYMTALTELDARIRQQVQGLRPECRKLVTNHDTLGYYAEAYGLTVVGSVIPGGSTGAQPSASDIADIVRKIKEQRVPAIFAETSLNPALIRQVGREAGVKVVDDLYGDSLGTKGSDGATYIKMMDANTAKIVGALRDCAR